VLLVTFEQMTVENHLSSNDIEQACLVKQR